MRPEEIQALHEAMQRSGTEQRVRLLARAVSASPGDLSALHLLCALDALDPNAFRTAMRDCIARDHRNVLALRALAWTARRAGRADEARACILGLLAMDPDHQALRLELLRSEMAWPGPDADRHIDECLRRIDDPFTRASSAFQLGLRFPHRARPRQRDDLARWMKWVAATQAEPVASALGTGPAHPDTVWRDLLRRLADARSVAVVGNGPSLLGRGFGAPIDAADLVIRINFPVIQAHEADVGSRTDVMVFSDGLLGRLPSLLARDPRYGDLPLLVVSALPSREDLLAASVSAGLRLGMMPATMRDSLTRLSYDLATTGCLILCLCAIMSTGSIALYGFDFYKDRTRPHYFSGHDQPFLGHDVDYERFFVEEVIPAIA